MPDHRRPRRAAAPLLALALVATACASPLPPPSLVDSLRVLAVRATPPVASPGAQVTLDLLLADPQGGGRALAIEWAGCLAPEERDPVRCLDEGRAAQLGSGPVAHVEIPSDALSTETDAVFGVVVLVCAGGRIEWGSARPLCVGGQEEILATKRILVAAEPADNPEVRYVSVSGVAAIDGEVLRLDPCGFRHCAPTRVSLTVGGPAPESLWTAFAATAGHFDEPYVDGPLPMTLWDAPAGGAARLYFVLRDDEGGVDWAIRDVQIEARPSP